RPQRGDIADAPPRLRRRAREVDGADGRRRAPDPQRQHAPPRPPSRSGPGMARPLASLRVGAPAARLGPGPGAPDVSAKRPLRSREVIADSIELVARGHMFDAIVAISGCDKTIPGCVMALARLDVPSVMLYGGSIAPGRFHGHDVTIQDVFEGVGAHAAGDMTDEELAELESVASPGAGACAGQYTANTMSTAFEML